MKDLRKELIKLRSILKKLELVYKTAIDEKQKQRVSHDIKQIRAKINRLEKYLEAGGEGGVLTEDNVVEETRIEEIEETEIPDDLKYLSDKIVHPLEKDPEVNLVINSLEEFEREYLGVLNEFNLKLDYKLAKERDKFYNELENCLRIVRDLMHTLDELLKKGASHSYKEKLKTMKERQERALIITTVKFYMTLSEFLSLLINDTRSGGGLVLNPHEKVKFSTLEGKKKLSNRTLIDALEHIKEYCDKIVNAINLPEEILRTNKSGGNLWL